MIDRSLSALIKAWITTVIASGLLLVALALTQLYSDAYLQGLRHALQLTAEEPPPDVLGLYAEDAGAAYAARAGHTHR